MTTDNSDLVLTSYQDLPCEGARSFRINDDLVTFSAFTDQGNLAGWIVTVTDPNYEGVLTYGTDSFVGERAMMYTFRMTGPFHMNNNPTLVTVAELRQIYFGEIPTP